MARRFGGKKDPFADLPSEFKDAVSQMSDDDIKKRIAEVALASHEVLTAKAKDQDLKDKIGAAKLAGQTYRDDLKQCRLKIAYAHNILEARGKA